MAGVSPINLIDAQLLKKVCPNTNIGELAMWVGPLQQACNRYGISTVRRVAAFIAQCAHESAGFTAMGENLHYSADGLRKTFSKARISDADCQRYGKTADHPADVVGIANCVYGGDWGAKNLGNTQPGDGWTFRGGGPLQVTGRANWTAFANGYGIPLDEAIDFGRTREGGAALAGFFWITHHINELADTPGVEDETRAINGGTNGLDDRRAKFDALVKALLAKGA